MVVDLVVKGGVLASANGIFNGALAVDDGVIVSVCHDANVPQADLTIDARGKLILPGIIDGHCHFWDPGSSWREDFETGTKAAAAGGVTTVFDHGYTNPIVLDASTFSQKLNHTRKKAIVDFGLHAGVSADSIDKIPEVWSAGCAGIKIFMCFGGPEFKHLDDGHMLAALREMHKVDALALIHAENDSMINYNEVALKNDKSNSAELISKWRPPICEMEAIRRAVFLFEQTGVRGVIVHTSVADGINVINDAKKRGVRVFAESCPHYFYLSEDDLKTKGPWIASEPPVRPKEELALMWQQLAAGRVDTIGSDHASYEQREKEMGYTDIWKVFHDYTGMPGVETLLPLMYDGVSTGRLPLERLVEVTSLNPSRIYGIFPRKGMLQVGSDGDFVVLDPKRTVKITGDRLHSKCKWTPYEGRCVRGWPDVTVVRGRVVMQEGEIVARPGSGEFVTRSSETHAHRDT